MSRVLAEMCHGHKREKLADLVGEKIVSIEIPKDCDEELIIVTDKGKWTLQAEGDCCSTSWFDRDHLDGAQIVRGQMVTGVEAREEPLGNPDDGRTRQEYDVIYSYEIQTARGCCVFEMRNSSNGYYGGWFNVKFESSR